MSVGEGMGGVPGGAEAVPYMCPFCGEEDLAPAGEGRWHCRACRRLFSLTFHGLSGGHPSPEPTAPPPTPASGVRRPDLPDTGGDRPSAGGRRRGDDLSHEDWW